METPYSLQALVLNARNVNLFSWDVKGSEAQVCGPNGVHPLRSFAAIHILVEESHEVFGVPQRLSCAHGFCCGLLDHGSNMVNFPFTVSGRREAQDDGLAVAAGFGAGNVVQAEAATSSSAGRPSEDCLNGIEQEPVATLIPVKR
jgi:hypothetical protein